MAGVHHARFGGARESADKAGAGGWGSLRVCELAAAATRMGCLSKVCQQWNVVCWMWACPAGAAEDELRPGRRSQRQMWRKGSYVNMQQTVRYLNAPAWWALVSGPVFSTTVDEGAALYCCTSI